MRSRPTRPACHQGLATTWGGRDEPPKHRRTAGLYCSSPPSPSPPGTPPPPPVGGSATAAGDSSGGATSTTRAATFPMERAQRHGGGQAQRRTIGQARHHDGSPSTQSLRRGLWANTAGRACPHRVTSASTYDIDCWSASSERVHASARVTRRPAQEWMGHFGASIGTCVPHEPRASDVVWSRDPGTGCCTTLRAP